MVIYFIRVWLYGNKVKLGGILINQFVPSKYFLATKAVSDTPLPEPVSANQALQMLNNLIHCINIC